MAKKKRKPKKTNSRLSINHKTRQNDTKTKTGDNAHEITLLVISI